ncbi:MAG: GntR family transcriptional regulator [Muribaculaceae bacterium]|nr:GntR family transcriptional regulator [Muribaculaceae bacterium]
MKIGQYNTLKLNRMVDFGAYLIDEQGNEVLMPRRYLTPDMHLGDMVEVFVYNDSENRPVATTERPLAVVGDTCLMRVKAVDAVGAFLDWGLAAKDLLVPFREQRVRMQAGRSYIVHVYLDQETNRIVASAKIDRWVNKTKPDYYHRQMVNLLVVQRTDLGYKVLVNNCHWGLIYQNETYRDVNVGDQITGFVKQVRPDGKIDVTIEKMEKLRIDDLAKAILQHLHNHCGSMSLSDKSTPEQISATFSCSKKDFKKAIGLLYKQHLITLDNAVHLVKQ